jgi:hypothetical protein
VCDRVDTCIIKNRVRFCSKVSFGDPQTGIGSLWRVTYKNCHSFIKQFNIYFLGREAFSCLPELKKNVTFF